VECLSRPTRGPWPGDGVVLGPAGVRHRGQVSKGAPDSTRHVVRAETQYNLKNARDYYTGEQAWQANDSAAPAWDVIANTAGCVSLRSGGIA